MQEPNERVCRWQVQGLRSCVTPRARKEQEQRQRPNQEQAQSASGLQQKDRRCPCLCLSPCAHARACVRVVARVRVSVRSGEGRVLQEISLHREAHVGICVVTILIRRLLVDCRQSRGDQKRVSANRGLANGESLSSLFSAYTH